MHTDPYILFCYEIVTINCLHFRRHVDISKTFRTQNVVTKFVDIYLSADTYGNVDCGHEKSTERPWRYL